MLDFKANQNLHMTLTRTALGWNLTEIKPSSNKPPKTITGHKLNQAHLRFFPLDSLST
jgi:hypothetical protein